MNTKIQMALVLIGVICTNIHAKNITQIDRYVTVDNKPKAAQINPLLTIVQVHFPNEVESVGDAVDYWISYSGYKLVDKKALPKDVQSVLTQKLPQADRNLGPLTIQDGLKVLAGQDVFDLVCDPLHRLVSFELKKQYKLAMRQSKGKRA